MLMGHTAAARRRVLEAAREGRATYLPAWARENSTARVLIDGEEVGQASTLAHYVRQDSDAPSVFGEKPLLPEHDRHLPRDLRA